MEVATLPRICGVRMNVLDWIGARAAGAGMLIGEEFAEGFWNIKLFLFWYIVSPSFDHVVYLCSHEMVTATTNFAIPMGRLEDRKEKIEKSKDRDDERSEAGWRSGRRPKAEKANHSNFHHSPLLVEECQADHVDTDGWLDNCDITQRTWAASISP